YLNLVRVCEMLSPNDPDALNRARHALEQLAPLEPKDPAPLMELARIAEKQRDLKGALAYLAHARDLKPNYAPVHFFFAMGGTNCNLRSKRRNRCRRRSILILIMLRTTTRGERLSCKAPPAGS